MDTLLLTAEEKVLFERQCPDALRSTWNDRVEAETLNSFETPRQMEFRLSILADRGNQPVQALLKRVQTAVETGDLEQFSFQDLPEDQMYLFYSCLGANGLTALLQLVLQEIDDEEDLHDAVAFSQIRHALLKSNAEFFTAV